MSGISILIHLLLSYYQQSATINWTSSLSSRTAAGKDDVVKVEVWDVVDRAIVVDKPTSESMAAEMVYNLTGEGTVYIFCFFVSTISQSFYIPN